MQTGARGVRRGAKRCKKVQVQVQIRLKRFRCTGAPAGSANSYGVSEEFWEPTADPTLSVNFCKRLNTFENFWGTSANGSIHSTISQPRVVEKV